RIGAESHERLPVHAVAREYPLGAGALAAVGPQAGNSGATMSSSIETLVNREYQFGFVTDVDDDTIPAGLSEDTVRAISARKRGPEWLLEWRLKAYCR